MSDALRDMEIERNALRTSLRAVLTEAESLRARVAAVERYVEDPGNWSALDGRRLLIRALLAGVPLRRISGGGS